jgi:membrane fusion protein (multidrug efflux system)
MDHLRVRNGSLLDEGELLTTLSDINRLWVYFNVPESEYLDFQQKKPEDKGDLKVRLKMANGDIFHEMGQIETIEADFDNTAGNIEFRATFPNPDGLLRHGQTGTIVMKQSYPNALLIPQKATFEILDRMFVYVVDVTGKVQQRPIEVEAEIPYFFLIRSGIGEEDIVLSEGLRKVRPGDQIIPELVPAEALRRDLELHAE